MEREGCTQVAKETRGTAADALRIPFYSQPCLPGRP
jgi:hypothetical protein